MPPPQKTGLSWLILILASGCSQSPPAPDAAAVLKPTSFHHQAHSRLLHDSLQAFVHHPTGTRVLNRSTLRALVDERGFSLVPQGTEVERVDDLLSGRGSWAFRYRPLALAGDDGSVPVGNGRIEHSADRVLVLHSDLLTHELRNSPEALKQSFRVHRDLGPEFVLRAGVQGPVALELRAGELFVAHAGRTVLRASAPRAFDADGREIAAAFELAPGRLDIRVWGASRYPVLIDPAWEAAGEDQQGAWFGWSLTGAGDVNKDGLDDVVVAAPFFHTGNPSAGKVYLYYGNADGLSAQPAWSSSGDDANRALFGWSVASADVDGDGYSDLVVGAPSRTGTGKVFLFRGSFNGPLPASWTSEGDGQAGAFFGTSVARAGDVNDDGYDDVVVGAPAESFADGPSASPGKAFVFHGSSGGLGQGAAWSSEGDGQAGAGFGWSVAGAGDVNGDGRDDVVIGANLYDLAYSDTGRVFLFLGGDAGLAASPGWADSGDAQASAQFGWSVSSAGDVNADGFYEVIVGAPGHDTPNSGAGRAYVYQGGHPESGLHQAYWWVDSGSDRTGAGFGWSVACAGDVADDGFPDLLIGAPGDSTAASNGGRAFLFDGSPGGPLTPPSFSSSGDAQTGAGFGGAVAPAGDVNGDGAADLLVGAYAADGTAQDSGKAFLFLGTPGQGPCEPPGTPCDDNDDCTHTDACVEGGLCRGTPFSCEDQNPCTDDLCRPDGTCGHLHNTAPCDDGDPCTENDACANARCRGVPVDCSWLNDGCKQGFCDPSTGLCQPQPAPDGTPCDDGDPCTADESCEGGVCIHHAFTCGDGDSGCGCGSAATSAEGPGWLLAMICLGLLLRPGRVRRLAGTAGTGGRGSRRWPTGRRGAGRLGFS